MEIKIAFPGGHKVAAHLPEHTVATDQPVRSGGDGTAPSPFDLFLASIAACGGFYALRFCQQRGIEVENLGLTLRTVREPSEKQISRLVFELTAPPEFPVKYRRPLERAIDQCTVKRHIVEPPEFETRWID